MVERMPLIERLGRGLKQASGARDWQALARLDRELSLALRDWADVASWSVAERGALQALHRRHQEARLHCAAELQNLAQTLEQMRAGQGRWQAYAESSNWSDSAQDEEARA
ncbi:hypothetical protein OOZ63_07615 [Paucibacter sp. PLA-PC-4]|nr:hypothetical protein [Paucibacter sp. PLA-PC-4]